MVSTRLALPSCAEATQTLASLARGCVNFIGDDPLLGWQHSMAGPAGARAGKSINSFDFDANLRARRALPGSILGADLECDMAPRLQCYLQRKSICAIPPV